MKGTQSIKDPSCKEFLISGNYKIGEPCLQCSEGKMASKVELETQPNHQPMWWKNRTIFRDGNPPAQEPLLLRTQTHHESLKNLCTFFFSMWFPPPHLKWHLPFHTVLRQVQGTLSPAGQQFYVSCKSTQTPQNVQCITFWIKTIQSHWWNKLGQSGMIVKSLPHKWNQSWIWGLSKITSDPKLLDLHKPKQN